MTEEVKVENSYTIPIVAYCSNNNNNKNNNNNTLIINESQPSEFWPSDHFMIISHLIL